MPAKITDRELGGREIGLWKVTHERVRMTHTKHARWGWKCVCACGYVGLVDENNLIRGGSQCCLKCRQKNAWRADDLIGRSVKNWTVLSLHPESFKAQQMMVCRCDCGAEQLVPACRLRTGSKLPGCETCRDLRYGESAGNRLWQRVVRGARERNLEILISQEDALRLLEQQGYCCALTGLPINLAAGSTAHERGDSTASLDRIDSDGPYAAGNVQWVHKDVNRMKNAYSQDRFFEVCRLVTERRALKLKSVG